MKNKPKSIYTRMSSSEKVLMHVSLIIERRDPCFYGHTERLSQYCYYMGEASQLPEESIRNLVKAAFFHDIGMIIVPDTVLLKQIRLTSEELNLIKKHADFGAALCEKIKSLKEVVPIIRHHHEKDDGTGYPAGLVGSDIPLESKILTLCDVLDALTAPRPNRAAYDIIEAVSIIKQEAEWGDHPCDIITKFLLEIDNGLYEKIDRDWQINVN